MLISANRLLKLLTSAPNSLTFSDSTFRVWTTGITFPKFPSFRIPFFWKWSGLAASTIGLRNLICATSTHLTTVAITKSHASRPWKHFSSPLPSPRLQVSAAVLITLLRCDFQAFFARLGSVVHVATLHYCNRTVKSRHREYVPPRLCYRMNSFLIFRLFYYDLLECSISSYLLSPITSSGYMKVLTC